MCRIAAHGDDGLISIPETKCLEPGVDGPFGPVADFRVASGAHAVEGGFAVVGQIAAIRADFFDLRLTDAEVRDPRRLLQTLAESASDTLDGFLMKLDVADTAFRLRFLEELFRREVGDGGIVLM